MPTGYTAVILEKPETTFPNFALRCARAFGACVRMRDVDLDAPPPDEIKPKTYDLERLRASEALARELEVMTVEEADRRDAEAYEEALIGWEHGMAEHQRERELFGAMLVHAMGWEPPTPHHVELKRFMIDQLTTSMPNESFWARMKPVRKGGRRWLDEARRAAAESIERHAADWKKEQETAARNTEWLRALRASLPSSDGSDRGNG